LAYQPRPPAEAIIDLTWAVQYVMVVNLTLGGIPSSSLHEIGLQVINCLAQQHYWASRVSALGIGTSVVGALNTEILASALREVLEPAVAPRSRSLAQQLSSDGAMVAARLLVAL